MRALAFDVLVVGSGIAGLSFALDVAGPSRVLIVTKKERAASNTNYARGGIAAVMGPDDDPELHLADTLICGAGLCRREAVEILVREGPAGIRELLDRGVEFEHDGPDLSLGMEGGHSRRRIIHSGDRTGVAIESALLARVGEHPQIEILDDHYVEDLLVVREDSGDHRCAGAQVIHEHTDERIRVHASITLLASGGFCHLYRHTTNPPIATGDGIAMAYRAGAPVANMEFVQFHPTALFPPEDPAFLISEAVRGEGAIIRGRDGRPVMERHDPRGSLAPRDIVARAIDSELRETGADHVILDLGGVDRRIAEGRFAATIAGCRSRGVRPFEDGIPVVPAAHYGCGGIATDDLARTGLPGLLAVGEVAYTGVHGANRLASNSLLEAVVFARRASSYALEMLPHQAPQEGGGSPPPRLRGEIDLPDSQPGSELVGAIAERGLAPLRDLMWTHAGIVRDIQGLEFAVGQIEPALLALEADHIGGGTQLAGAELRNAVLTALLVVRSAVSRKESRGLHFLLDHPWRDNEHGLRETVLHRDPRGSV